MLLVELTINDVVNYISDEPRSLTRDWEAAIFSFGNPQMTLPTDYGGYCRMILGDIALKPSLFTSDWPPPKTCAIKVKHSATTEGEATVVYEGTASRRSFDAEEVVYTLKEPDYDETVADATSYGGSDDLDDSIGAILTGIAEIDILNTDNARASSPIVNHTVSGDTLSIELASTMAAFYGHMFYISGNVAYLIDMLLFNGTSTLNEFQYFPPVYWDKEPVASVKETTTTNDYTRFSAYPHGRRMEVASYNSDTEVKNNAALDNIITLENRSRCTVEIPMSVNIPSPGEKITFTDTRVEVSTDIELYARTFRFDLQKSFVGIEGDAVITAT